MTNMINTSIYRMVVAWHLQLIWRADDSARSRVHMTKLTSYGQSRTVHACSFHIAVISRNWNEHSGFSRMDKGNGSRMVQKRIVWKRP